jgi:hypothetical protein
VARALLTTGDARADKKETLLLKLLCTADGVWVVRVTTVDDDVTFVENRDKLADQRIDGWASLDEEDDLARCLELRYELLGAESTLNIGSYTRALRSVRLRTRRYRMGKNAPLASFSRKCLTFSVERLKATTLNPLSFMLRIRFWPCF